MRGSKNFFKNNYSKIYSLFIDLMDSTDASGPSNKQGKSGEAKAVEKKSAENLSLPFSHIKRIVASHLAADTKIAINKEATLAFSGETDAFMHDNSNPELILLSNTEAAKVFIGYISTASSDICKEKKRQTISSSDVITALEELDFGNLVPPLKEFLMLYQKAEGEKKAKKQAASKLSKAKKRKTMDDVPASDHDDEVKEAAEEGTKADE